jgi:hypothetical protein
MAAGLTGKLRLILVPNRAAGEQHICVTRLPMAGGVETDLSVWTAADLMTHFGPIVLNRVCHDPLPGRATEEDSLRVNERHDTLCELVDGALVVKAMGNYESMLAVALVRFLSDFLAQHNLGVVLGPDGMLWLRSGLGDVLPGFALPLKKLFVTPCRWAPVERAGRR